MRSPGTQLQAAVMVAAWLLAAPALAFGQENNSPPAPAKPAEPADRLNRLDSEVAAMSKKLDDLAAVKAELTEVKKQLQALAGLQSALQDLGDLKTQLQATTKLNLQVQQATRTIADMEKRVLDLTADVAGMRSDLGRLQVDLGRTQTVLRQANAINPATPTVPGAATTGQLQLVNAYLMPMTVVVDGLAYVLQPGETRSVTRPAGAFTYEVPGVQANALRTVAAGETFTIRVGMR